VKAFGISFLAMPRSPHAEHAVEAPLAMRAPMWLLGAACVVLGLASTVVIASIYRVLETIEGLALHAPRVPQSLWIEAPRRLGQISPVLIAALLVIVVLAAMLPGLRSRRRPRVTDTWGCGRIVQTPRMEYTAAAFAEPLRRVFAELYRPTEDLTVSRHPESPYFVRAITYRTEVRPWVDALLYDPVIRFVRASSLRVRRLQGGSVHLYLLYLVAALLLALASLWWF
jgi:hydrogenase-4 component B